MRSRRLLFVFASILSGAVTPAYAALGGAPRCLPVEQETLEIADINLPIPELRKAMPIADPEERDYLIRTIAFEASGEPEEGKSAVAHVILNRKLIGRWGDNIKDVVTHPWQFEPWMTRRGPHRRRHALPQPNDRSQAARRFTAGMGAWRGTTDRPAYLLFA
jgi:Cell Wall Hydrolase